MEDRSALFNQLQGFSHRKLKKVETKVVTGLGEKLVEKRGAKGLQVLSGGGATGGAADTNDEPARKLDLQVGFVLPGLLMGSQDVAHDKSSLESYGIEYILNLDSEVENKFEDDYNYKNVPIKDKADFELEKVLDECFDFIDDGRHRSNVFVHCSGTVGLSRTTTICIAYLMNKEKQSFNDAFNNVKEARSFVKPNEGFIKQLKDYEVKMRGAQAVKDSGIDDPFALRKKQEIEQEKAMVAGAASVKNRMKMFGATLDTGASPRSKSVSPMPGAKEPAAAPPSSSQTSKWGAAKPTGVPQASSQSKSMTPEPRKSWQAPPPAAQAANMPPPPPPPMPTVSLHANESSSKSASSSSNKSFPPPPPPPQPPVGSLLKGGDNKNSSSSSSTKASPTTSPAKNQASTISNKPPVQKSQVDSRKPSVSESSDDERQKMVFGRRPPPPMKIRGGLSIERNDSIASNASDKPAAPKATRNGNGIALNLDIQRNHRDRHSNELISRCPSPLVLMNNVTPSPPVTQNNDLHKPRFERTGAQQNGNSQVIEELKENPFEYWQRTLKKKSTESPHVGGGQAPHRTVSLGPRRPKQVGSMLQSNPFLRQPEPSSVETNSPSRTARSRNVSESFDKAARELQSSLTELNELIHSPEIGSSATLGRRPPRARQEPASRSTNLAIKIETEDESSEAPKWQWQEDLTNWKMSSSVNDLRSMFNQPVAQQNKLPPTVSHSTSLRPPSSAVITSNKPPLLTGTLKKNPWLDGTLTRDKDSSNDYTIRRTTSVSSSSSNMNRPVLRNPYRGQY